jgi:hypothetical protein
MCVFRGSYAKGSGPQSTALELRLDLTLHLPPERSESLRRLTAPLRVVDMPNHESRPSRPPTHPPIMPSCRALLSVQPAATPLPPLLQLPAAQSNFFYLLAESSQQVKRSSGVARSLPCPLLSTSRGRHPSESSRVGESSRASCSVIFPPGHQ